MKRFIVLILSLCLVLCGCEVTIVFETDPAATQPDASTLTVHFLDVGQADCALLECDGKFMLIDGGNVDDSRLVVSYLLEQGVETLDAVICSHAHEDHVGGLPGVLATFPAERIFAPTVTYASTCFDDFLRYADQQDKPVEIPSPGDSFPLGDAQITVLGPVKTYAETNDTSIVVRVDFLETSFLFTGDMEVLAEIDMLNHWGEEWQTADVLKVGHHGSSTSSGHRFLYETMPEYAVISVGTGNTYAHPHDAPLSRLYHADCTIFRTDELGTVIAVSDGYEITFTWEKQNALPLNADPGDLRFIANASSRKVHTSTCAYLPGESNRVYFDSYWEAIDAGYSPCFSCLP